MCAISSLTSIRSLSHLLMSSCYDVGTMLFRCGVVGWVGLFISSFVNNMFFLQLFVYRYEFCYEGPISLIFSYLYDTIQYSLFKCFQKLTR